MSTQTIVQQMPNIDREFVEKMAISARSTGDQFQLNLSTTDMAKVLASLNGWRDFPGEGVDCLSIIPDGSHLLNQSPGGMLPVLDLKCFLVAHKNTFVVMGDCCFFEYPNLMQVAKRNEDIKPFLSELWARQYGKGVAYGLAWPRKYAPDQMALSLGSHKQISVSLAAERAKLHNREGFAESMQSRALQGNKPLDITQIDQAFQSALHTMTFQEREVLGAVQELLDLCKEGGGVLTKTGGALGETMEIVVTAQEYLETLGTGTDGRAYKDGITRLENLASKRFTQPFQALNKKGEKRHGYLRGSIINLTQVTYNHPGYKQYQKGVTTTDPRSTLLVITLDPILFDSSWAYRLSGLYSTLRRYHLPPGTPGNIPDKSDLLASLLLSIPPGADGNIRITESTLLNRLHWTEKQLKKNPARVKEKLQSVIETYCDLGMLVFTDYINDRGEKVFIFRTNINALRQGKTNPELPGVSDHEPQVPSVSGGNL